MPRPGNRKRKALKLAAVKSQGCGNGVGTGSNPSGTGPTFPSTHSGDPTVLCTSKVPVSPPLGDVPSSSKKRTFDDSVTLTNLPKGKEFKKFCGHIATGDYELASRTGVFKCNKKSFQKYTSKSTLKCQKIPKFTILKNTIRKIGILNFIILKSTIRKNAILKVQIKILKFSILKFSIPKNDL